jgi:hypothetical protein
MLTLQRTAGEIVPRDDPPRPAVQGSRFDRIDRDDQPAQYNGTYGSANFFDLIGQRPQLGRDFGGVGGTDDEG